MCVLIKDIGRRLRLELQYSVDCTRVNRVVLVSLCAETIKTGTKSDSCERKCIVYPVSRITGEGRAEFLRALGPGFEQEGAEGGGAT